MTNSIYSPLYYINNQRKVHERIEASLESMARLPRVFTSDEYWSTVSRYHRSGGVYSLDSLRAFGVVEIDHQEVFGYSNPGLNYTVVFVDGFTHDFSVMPSNTRAMKECPGHGTVAEVHAVYGEAVPVMYRNFYRINEKFDWDIFIARQKDKLMHCAEEVCSQR